MKYYSSKNKKGFTLIEIIVSLALFAVVATVSIGAFLKIIAANRKSQAIETSVNDANFALESMVRDLRVGTDYQCLASAASIPSSITSPSIATCSLSSNVLAFNSYQTAAKSGGGICNLIHAYQLSGSVIQKAEQATCGQSYLSGTFTFQPLTSTSSNLTIQNFQIKVDGTLGSVQPKVFILIGGYSGVNEADKATFVVQTTAEQRIMQ